MKVKMDMNRQVYNSLLQAFKPVRKQNIFEVPFHQPAQIRPVNRLVPTISLFWALWIRTEKCQSTEQNNDPVTSLYLLAIARRLKKPIAISKPSLCASLEKHKYTMVISVCAAVCWNLWPGI